MPTDARPQDDEPGTDAATMIGRNRTGAADAARHGPEGDARRPATRVLVALLGLEAVAVAAGGVLGIGAAVRGERPAVAAFVVVFALAGAAGLAAAARSFWRGSVRARGPVATWQLLQGATAVTLLQAGATPGPTWATLAVSFAVLALLVARSAPSSG